MPSLITVFILKSKDSMKKFLEAKIGHKVLVLRGIPHDLIGSEWGIIGHGFGYKFLITLPVILHRKPERKVKHTKQYSNKLKELQELKHLGATEVTLTPEDEKFLDLTIDSFE